MRNTVILGLLSVSILGFGFLVFERMNRDAELPVQEAAPSAAPAHETSIDHRLEGEGPRAQSIQPAETLSVDASSSRAAINEPPVTIAPVGSVKNIVATESAMPGCEITIVVGSKVNKVIVAAGTPYHVSGIAPGPARITISA